MDLRYLFESYKKYSKKYNLQLGHHRTYISLLQTKISGLLEWCSLSKNSDTDRYTNIVYYASTLFKKLESSSENLDESELFLINGEEPNLFLQQLADILIYLILYIVNNNLEDKFLMHLNDLVLKDKNNNIPRFNNKRLK